jgi:hypothetical protein
MSTFGVVVKWSPRPSVVSETLAGPGRRDAGPQLNRNAEGLAVGRSGRAPTGLAGRDGLEV